MQSFVREKQAGELLSFAPQGADPRAGTNPSSLLQSSVTLAILLTSRMSQNHQKTHNQSRTKTQGVVLKNKFWT